MMSKDKYPTFWVRGGVGAQLPKLILIRTFSGQMEAIVFIIVQIFFATSGFFGHV